AAADSVANLRGPLGGTGGVGSRPRRHPLHPGGTAEGMTADFYDLVHRRRDVRSEFTGAPVDPAVLERVLGAAHAAPSVGLSQPWDFVLLSSAETKQTFWEHVQQERQRFADSLTEARKTTFADIKIDGVMESSLSIVVTYDH